MTPDDKKLCAHFIVEINSFMKSDDFQLRFFASLEDQFESKGFLSEPQLECLRKIYDRVTS